MKRIALTVLTVALAAAAFGSSAVPSFAEDKVVATINGKPITEGDLSVAESEIGSDMGTMPAPQKRMSLLEFLIDNQLFAEAAEGAETGSGRGFRDAAQLLEAAGSA